MLNELPRCLRAFDRTVERSLRDAGRRTVEAWSNELTGRIDAIKALLADPRIAPAIEIYVRTAAQEIEANANRIRLEIQQPGRQQVIIESELIAMRATGYSKEEVVEAVRSLVRRAGAGQFPPIPRSGAELLMQVERIQRNTLRVIRARQALSRAAKKEQKRRIREGSTKILFGVTFVVANAVLPSPAIASMLAGAEKIWEGAQKLAS